MPKSEKTIQASILKWLNAQPKTWAVKFPGVLQRGVPDVICGHRGFFYAFEVKTRTGEVSPIQRATIKKMNEDGACRFACVVRSLDEVRLTLKGLPAANPIGGVCPCEGLSAFLNVKELYELYCRLSASNDPGEATARSAIKLYLEQGEEALDKMRLRRLHEYIDKLEAKIRILEENKD
jgi:hypothetical protein